MALLVSAFLPPPNPNAHIQEIFAAINTNFLNRFLVEVHILTESDCIELEHELIQHANTMPDEHEIIRQIDQKLTCARTRDRKQPTYADFFRYANETLSGKVVLFSNADVVFDDSLGLVEPGPLKRHEHGYILSVSPPPHDGVYKRVFHRECDNTPRCVVGNWQGGGSWGQTYAGCSWDGYIFSPPLSSKMNLSHIDVIMNMNGAENLAGYQLEVGASISLHNPCYHVHAWHWHCQGGKMHTRNNFVRADHPAWLTRHWGQPPHSPADAVDHALPCWNCPGVKLPEGSVGPKEYCRDGTILNSTWVSSLTDHFRSPLVSLGICCKEPHSCWKLQVEWLPHCLKPEDVNCVTWEVVAPHRYY
jgi:hypothetical protein